MGYGDDLLVTKLASKIKKQFLNAKIRKIKCKNRSELFHRMNRKTTFKLINE